jgi:hypothetical protein
MAAEKLLHVSPEPSAPRVPGRAPDADLPTVHVRCGSDIRHPLSEAGFVGDFLEISNPYCQGPVPAGTDLPAVRAEWLAAAYGLERKKLERRLRAEEDALPLLHRAERVVLWFEHDSYDQLILARVLAGLAEGPLPPVLDIICIDRFPGVGRFKGLGQLNAVQLRSLWSRRSPVAPGQLSLGVRVWKALRQPSPMPLHALTRGRTPALPMMSTALIRHLRELPWVRDGLSLTERLTLQALDRETLPLGQLFMRTEEAEPLPYLGDMMFFAIVRSLADAPNPAVEIEPPAAGEGPQTARVRLTEMGRALVAGRIDWLNQNPHDRWVGGIHIRPGPNWRWNEQDGKPVMV